MRKSFLTLTILLVAALPALADIGTVTLTLASTIDNSTLDQNTAVGIIDFGAGKIPATLNVTVRFSATTKGADGSNSGVFGVYGNITGSALGVQTKQMTQNATFKKAMGQSQLNPTFTPSGSPGPGTVVWNGPMGLGFDAVVDLGSLTPGVDGNGIYGFGASQVTSAGGEDFGRVDAQYAGHPAGSHPTVALNARNGSNPLLANNEAYVSALGTSTVGGPGAAGVVAFTGTVNLLGGSNTGLISLKGQAGLWALGGGQTAAALVSNGSLLILPEPTTIGLLAPLALFLVRRRQA